MNSLVYLFPILCLAFFMPFACTDDDGITDFFPNVDAGTDSDTDTDADSDTDADTDTDTDSDTDADGDKSRHDICADIGNTLGMGAAIFGDTGSTWVLTAAQPSLNIDWTYGYLYISGDPDQDLDTAESFVNLRLDTAEEMGASIPTTTFYRMLNVGEDHGFSGNEPQIVQQMLQDADAVRDYLDDFIALLQFLNKRTTPTLVHVEPDSWGFMIWAFGGGGGTSGNSDAASISVNLSGAAHNALEGQGFPDHAGGLGRAMLYLRDQYAPGARLGWHASNFRVGTHPETVTQFYGHMGKWDVIVTEPPHMVDNGSNTWSSGAPDNTANLNWLNTVSTNTGLPILIWQTYVDAAAPYIGAWPGNRANLTSLAQNGVAGVLWDPNGDPARCNYTCNEGDNLLTYLSEYSKAPLSLPASNICSK